MGGWVAEDEGDYITCCVGSVERWEDLHVYEYNIIGCGAIASKCILA